MSDLPIVLVAYDDHRRSVYLWSNLARGLGAVGRRPLFVTQPRRPGFAATCRALAARGRWCPPEQPPGEDGIALLEPLDLPAQRFATLARWDRASLEWAIRREGQRAGRPGWVVLFPPALWKPWPRPAGWRTCWFPNDDFASGNPRFAAREDDVLRNCDLLVSVSESVVAPRRDRVPRSAVLPNGYDGALFRRTPELRPDPEVAALPGPRLGYVGAISPTKVDVDLLARLATARPGASVVLVGPVPDQAAVAPLRPLGNVHFLPSRPRDEVPAVVAALDACLLPYLDTPMNRSCSPLKVREALALGVPVISTPVDELRAHPGAATVCDDDGALLAAVDRLAAGELRTDPAAAAWFTGATWEERAREFAALLDPSGEDPAS